MQSRLEAVEKYKGCAFPSLPGKTLIGKNSEDVVEGRKGELQIYIQLLAKHTLIKYDPTLKFFLTCENYEEFERAKNNPNEVVAVDSTSSTVKNFGLKDTFSYLYSSIKTKLADNQTTKSDIQLNEINGKSIKHVNFLTKIIALTTARIAYRKKEIDEQLQLSKAFKEIKDEKGEVNKVFKGLSSSFTKETTVTSYLLSNDANLLNQLKEKKLKQEGIQAAIAERIAV